MDIGLKVFEIKIDDATFYIRDSGKDGFFKFNEWRATGDLQRMWQMVLDNIERMEGVKIGEREISVDEFKALNISSGVMAGLVKRYSEAMSEEVVAYSVKEAEIAEKNADSPTA